MAHSMNMGHGKNRTFCSNIVRACKILIRVTTSYLSKVTLVGALHAKTIAGAVWKYVFRIAFPASLLLCHPKGKPLHESWPKKSVVVV